jgi:hypothetical protein
MAKKPKKASKGKGSKKKKAKKKVSLAKGSPARIEKAAAIVAQVLVHFGAGYGAQRQTENPGGAPPNQAIFATPADSAKFHHKLLKSTFDSLDILPFSTNQGLRDQICSVAFQHGMLARQRVVTDGTPALVIQQILDTLETVKALCPPGGAGGGRVCT